MKNKAFQSMEGKVRTELENLIRASKEFINKKSKKSQGHYLFSLLQLLSFERK